MIYNNVFGLSGMTTMNSRNTRKYMTTMKHMSNMIIYIMSDSKCIVIFNIHLKQ